MSDVQVATFFEVDSATFSYVVYCTAQRECVIIDPVLNYDALRVRTSTESAQEIVDFIQAQQLHVKWILETHVHADHLSAASWLKAQLGGEIAISAYIHQVRDTFMKLYDLHSNEVDLHAFDQLLQDQQQLICGLFTITVLHVPGHTPADLAFYIPDVGLFVGDTLFMPDVGTARCDFPGGSAASLYASIQRLLQYPDDTVLWLCHDYPPNDRPPQHYSSVGAQKTSNIHIHTGISEAQFIALREKRDRTLAPPRLLLPALQVNIQAGKLPAANAQGQRFLKLPMNYF